MRFKEFLGEAWPRRGQEDFLLIYFIGGRKGRQKFLSRARADKEFEACKRDPQVSKVILYGGKPGRLVDEPLASWSRGDKS